MPFSRDYWPFDHVNIVGLRLLVMWVTRIDGNSGDTLACLLAATPHMSCLMSLKGLSLMLCFLVVIFYYLGTYLPLWASTELRNRFDRLSF